MEGSAFSNTSLIAIGQGIYLRKPIKGNVTRPLVVEPTPESKGILQSLYGSPTIILIFTWMGARLPHLLKYSDVYSEIYPESTQIIVRSEPSFFWSAKSTKAAHLQPVVEALEILGCLPPAYNASNLVKEAAIDPILPYPAPRVLVHSFSNGGSWQLSTLSDILESRSRPSNYGTTDLPLTALIFDSCPGHGGVDGTLRAFSGVVRNPILRKVVRFTIRLLYLYFAFRRRISLSKPQTSLDRMKARLNSKDLLPWFSKNTPRLYLYSATDVVVPYREVERHAEQAKAFGFPVTSERFANSPHVAHAKVYPQQYWAAIQRLWEGAARANDEDTVSED